MSGKLPRISADERRARLALRHHLAPAARAPSVLDAARGLVCLHATDPATVYLSAWARTTRPTLEAVDRALYHDRSLLRMLAMRRTMFVVPADDVAIFHAAAATGVARVERRRSETLVAMLGVSRPAAWLRKAETAALAALVARGEATAQELAEDVPALRRKVRINEGKAYAGDIAMSSRVLLLLALDGKVVRARPRGTWVSSQYRWAPLERWLGRPVADLPIAEAQVEVIRRWLARFGPGTEADMRWWTGWTAREVRAALAAIGAVEVELDDGRGYLLPGDLDRTPKPGPWVALLPPLDPTTMGWREREWYLGTHRGHLFDRNGNAGPTIWVNGRIVGGWAMRSTWEVVTRLLEDVGRASARAVDAEAARLSLWVSGSPAVARFPTPLATELIG
jgi:hypothetical protein